MTEWMIHGGMLDSACERYGIARDRWLDLSTGINANPYPLPDLAREYWHRLPDAGLDAWLRESAARCYGVAEPESVVPAPGTQALIQWLPRLFPLQRVFVVSPTYAEHERAWSAAGHSVRTGALDAIGDAGIVLLVNPNNPDGRLVDPQRLLLLASDRLVIVDEAFADVVPEVSVAGSVGSGNLVVLRSVGKMFGLAGMRLGFALAGREMAQRLRAVLGPWAVSGPAAAVGAVMLSDETWIKATRVRLKAAAGKLDGLLVRARLRLLGGTPLFRLVDSPHAPSLFEHLAARGILVRRFAAFDRWLRFGVPGNDADFERLGAALADWRPNQGSGSGPGAGLAATARG
ncbi:MAG: threonine-phosphate decarboxylase [Rhodospirillales bacterium]|nr:threonine-phosphate decarboxylase [Rhodospirillales bacterium]